MKSFKELSIEYFNTSFFQNNSYEELKNILLINYVIFACEDGIAWSIYNKKEDLKREFRTYIGLLIIVYNYLSPYTHLNILRHLESYHE